MTTAQNGATNAADVVIGSRYVPGGAIVNWSSLAGLGATAGTSVYSAAKAGVISFTKSAAVEYGANGIRVNFL